MQVLQGLMQALVDSVKDGIHVCRNLFPMIIPIVIVVKLLQEFGLVEYVAMPLAPIMDLMGLPAELGIVWAAAMLITIYSSLAILPGILITIPMLTVEQVTVLGLVILIAHSLILETRIAGRCGLSMKFQLILRVVVAIFAGTILHLFCSTFGIWQEEATILLVSQASTTWTAWAIGEFWNLVQIFILICVVMAFNRALTYLRISYYLGKILSPLLRLLGISPEATNVVIVGLFMGILYGSGVIIKNTVEGKISHADSFATMSLMSIAHALIEDTLLLMLIGGSIWGLLVFRLVIALFVGVSINIFYSKRRSVLTS